MRVLEILDIYTYTCYNVYSNERCNHSMYLLTDVNFLRKTK